MQIEVTPRFITRRKCKIEFIDAPLSELLQNGPDCNGTISESGKQPEQTNKVSSHTFCFMLALSYQCPDICTCSRRTFILCKHVL